MQVRRDRRRAHRGGDEPRHAIRARAYLGLGRGSRGRTPRAHTASSGAYCKLGREEEKSPQKTYGGVLRTAGSGGPRDSDGIRQEGIHDYTRTDRPINSQATTIAPLPPNASERAYSSMLPRVPSHPTCGRRLPALSPACSAQLSANPTSTGCESARAALAMTPNFLAHCVNRCFECVPSV